MAWLDRLWRTPGLHPLRAALGAAIGLTLAWGLTMLTVASGSSMPVLVASMGATSVLMFALPASPMAQPRAVLGGNLLSALAGISCTMVWPEPMFAIPASAALAILLMHLGRCLHAPGGGLALAPALGGPAFLQSGFGFVLMPVAINLIILLGVAWLFNNLTGSRYPHRPEPPMPPAGQSKSITPPIIRSDVEQVLDALEDRPDMTADELEALYHAISAQAAARDGKA